MQTEVALCAKKLASKNLTISCVESATAGWLCSEFALTNQSGQILKGGIVCYDVSIKETLLGVPTELIKDFTPESQEVTNKLAIGLKHLMPSNIQIAITGLTSPGGSETSEKPVGTMFISALIKDKLVSKKYLFAGNSKEIIKQTVAAAATLILNNT